MKVVSQYSIGLPRKMLTMEPRMSPHNPIMQKLPTLVRSRLVTAP